MVGGGLAAVRGAVLGTLGQLCVACSSPRYSPFRYIRHTITSSPQSQTYGLLRKSDTSGP